VARTGNKVTIRLTKPIPEARLALYYAAHCFSKNYPVPDRAQKEIVAAVARLRFHEAPDDVFGRSLEKGKHLDVARRRSEKSKQIFERIQELNNAGKPIGRGIFEIVGEEFGCSRTQIEKIYYAELRIKEETPTPEGEAEIFKSATKNIE
jgi:hypothetical protein